MFWITGLLGLALLIAPFAFGYQNDTYAFWASTILGAVMLIASAFKALVRDERVWEYWIVGVAGVLAILAPFSFGFTAVTYAFWASLGVGVAVIVLSGYEVFVAGPAHQ